MQEEFEKAAEFFAHRMALECEKEEYKNDILASFKADPETLVMAYQGATKFEEGQKDGDRLAASGGSAMTFGLLVRRTPGLVLLGAIAGIIGRKKLVHNRGKGIDVEDIVAERVDAYRHKKPRP